MLSSIKKHNFITIKIDFKREETAKQKKNIIVEVSSHSKAAAENLSNAYKFSHKTNQSEPNAFYYQFKGTVSSQSQSIKTHKKQQSIKKYKFLVLQKTKTQSKPSVSLSHEIAVKFWKQK